MHAYPHLLQMPNNMYVHLCTLCTMHEEIKSVIQQTSLHKDLLLHWWRVFCKIQFSPTYCGYFVTLPS